MPKILLKIPFHKTLKHIFQLVVREIVSPFFTQIIFDSSSITDFIFEWIEWVFHVQKNVTVWAYRLRFPGTVPTIINGPVFCHGRVYNMNGRVHNNGR